MLSFTAPTRPLARPLASIELAGIGEPEEAGSGATSPIISTASRLRTEVLGICSPARCRWVPRCLSAADQNRVSGPTASLTKGYATLGLFARYAFTEGLALEAGVENLLDKNDGLDLLQSRGASMFRGRAPPGAGRGVWARLGRRSSKVALANAGLLPAWRAGRGAVGCARPNDRC